MTRLCPMISDDDARQYHLSPTPGKLEIGVTVPMNTQKDLSLAYTPGVAVPVRDIAENKDDAYKYTSKGNLVAVISNGTAILGLGNKGALASKPVMEGKCALFKNFADVDAIDIEVDTEDIDAFCSTVEHIADTFGAINLEDIKAPECFTIEQRLKDRLSIPVFHDDQHGTAVVAGAALLNALELQEKQLSDVQIAMNGAGAASIAIAQFLCDMGADCRKVQLCDSRGALHTDRDDISSASHKYAWRRETESRTLADAMNGADVFIGVSIADCVTPEMVQSMNTKPILITMANPNPEIAYETAIAARDDAIIATGRSDHPNQVNNVLGFPALFRGALDTRASQITHGMKHAASRALAALAKHDVPDDVLEAYDIDSLSFGPHYILPKPLDKRVVVEVALAVATAAIDEGVSQIELDIEDYKRSLETRLL